MYLFLSTKKNVICVFLVIITLAIYFQVHDFQFVDFDDNDYVTENDRVLKGLTLENLQWAITASHSANWHPLTWMSHMLDVEIFGISSGKHHLINLFFHIANTLLVFILLNQVSGKIWQSSFVAVLFSIHPLHVESVAWVSERKDVLSTFFGLWTLYCYILYATLRRNIYIFASIFFYVLGLMAKPMLVTIPFILLLFDFWPLQRLEPYGSVQEKKHNVIINLLVEKIPFLILSVISAYITLIVQQKWGAVATREVYSLDIRIMNAVNSYVKYILLTFWPENLNVYYPYPKIFYLSKIKIYGIILFLISIIVFYMKNKYPYLLFGWLWFIGTLVPVIGIIQVGSQAMADRYSYIPIVGLFIIISWGFSDLLFALAWVTRTKIAITVGIICIVLSLLTWLQIGYWHNSIELFDRAISVEPNNFRIHYLLAKSLENRGKLDEAEKKYEEALNLNKEYIEARIHYAKLLIKNGKTDEVKKHVNILLNNNPKNEYVLNDVAIMYFQMKEYIQATALLLMAIEINPNYNAAKNNLKIIIGDLQQSVKSQPKNHSLKIELEKVYQLIKLDNDNNKNIYNEIFSNGL